MKSCYVDIHIHTSENADHLNPNYDIETLKKKVEKISDGNPYLISLTDHNVINIKAYQDLLHNGMNFVVGVELHIRTYEECPPYHCHFLFDIPEKIKSDEERLKRELEKINSILKQLYKKKMVSDDDDIPNIQEVIAKLVDYDFLILPHGGQSHSTFDVSVRNKDGLRSFDSVLERSIYYNLFDGFTSRTNKSVKRTEGYFKKLGISEFINLITCSDNYSPSEYPKDKNRDNNFVPTWMYSSPTFSGLRIALSEKSRLYYGEKPEDNWQEQIKSMSIKNSELDIDVSFEPGLNVIIGNSSSGKTLLVDTLVHKIDDTLDEKNCIYTKSFDFSNLNVSNNSGMHPHYFSQNYIIDLIKPSNEGKENSLDDNPLMKSIFPLSPQFKNDIERNLQKLNATLKSLIDSVSEIERIESEIDKIPSFFRLIPLATNVINPLKIFQATKQEVDKLVIIDDNNEIFQKLVEILNLTKEIPFCEPIDKEIASIREKISNANKEIAFAKTINSIIDDEVKREEKNVYNSDRELGNSKNREKLLGLAADYFKNLKIFNDSILTLSKFKFNLETTKIQSAGHTLSVNNTLTITPEILLDTFNKFLKKDQKLTDISNITPNSLFEENFSGKSPKVKDYDDFRNKVYEEISNKNIVKYDIQHKNGRHFSELSPGLKASVILDIILGYDGDSAPLIIDQPEDNLATNYINRDLIYAIKKCKKRRQIIMVSHNATIPMLGDAQNVIVCKNDGKITIRSFKMEDRYNDDETILDVIANVTDGGKTSIKKRFKKYNMRSYRGDENETQNY